jgi:hypothetical protein
MPLKGINYYRLKQVDADGKYSISATRSVWVNNDGKLNVYPNPVTSGLLYIKANIKITGIKITDLNGKTILKNFNSISLNIDHINVSSFMRGTYFIEVITNKNEVYHARFIKE